MFSVLQEIFSLAEDPRKPKRPTGHVLEEILCFSGLLPMASGNLRAQLHDRVSISDASPYGGASAVARVFSPLVPRCATEPIHDGFKSDAIKKRLPCPGGCKKSCDTLEELLSHRDHNCEGAPKGTLAAFGQFSSSPRYSLSTAVAHRGVEVLSPFVLLGRRAVDSLSAPGRESLKQRRKEVSLRWRHWSPDHRLMVRTGGRPIWLDTGRWSQGSPQVRTRAHPRGIPWLGQRWQRKLKRTNDMVDFALSELKVCNKHGIIAVIEHPWRS